MQNTVIAQNNLIAVCTSKHIYRLVSCVNEYPTPFLKFAQALFLGKRGKFSRIGRFSLSSAPASQ